MVIDEHIKRLEEKVKKLKRYCKCTMCNNCLLNDKKYKWFKPCSSQNCPNFEHSPETDLDKALILIGEIVSPIPNVAREMVGFDPVNRPSHYTDGKIEVIDFIEDKKLGFCLGNAVKYISRAGKKDPTKEVEDLKKAKWYIERRIKELEECPQQTYENNYKR